MIGSVGRLLPPDFLKKKFLTKTVKKYIIVFVTIEVEV